jgi:hypothetical protein
MNRCQTIKYAVRNLQSVENRHAPFGRVTFKEPARPAGTRSRAPLPAPYMTAQCAVGGWENRSEALAKGFIQVGWAVELSPERRRRSLFKKIGFVKTLLIIFR